MGSGGGDAPASRFSAPGSTLTLASSSHQSLRRPPSFGIGSMRPASTMGSGNGGATTLRGHFGGVCAAQTISDLGECLLASHTDRSRSAVVVYPEVAWRDAITDPSSEVETVAPELVGVGSSLMHQVRRQAYALEVEPGLRRLAGLAAIPGSSNCLVAVDLGGQSAHCLKFV